MIKKGFFQIVCLLTFVLKKRCFLLMIQEKRWTLWHVSGLWFKKLWSSEVSQKTQKVVSKKKRLQMLQSYLNLHPKEGVCLLVQGVDEKWSQIKSKKQWFFSHISLLTGGLETDSREKNVASHLDCEEKAVGGDHVEFSLMEKTHEEESVFEKRCLEVGGISFFNDKKKMLSVPLSQEVLWLWRVLKKSKRSLGLYSLNSMWLHLYPVYVKRHVRAAYKEPLFLVHLDGSQTVCVLFIDGRISYVRAIEDGKEEDEALDLEDEAVDLKASEGFSLGDSFLKPKGKSKEGDSALLKKNEMIQQTFRYACQKFHIVASEQIPCYVLPFSEKERQFFVNQKRYRLLPLGASGLFSQCEKYVWRWLWCQRLWHARLKKERHLGQFLFSMAGHRLFRPLSWGFFVVCLCGVLYTNQYYRVASQMLDNQVRDLRVDLMQYPVSAAEARQLMRAETRADPLGAIKQLLPLLPQGVRLKHVDWRCGRRSEQSLHVVVSFLNQKLKNEQEDWYDTFLTGLRRVFKGAKVQSFHDFEEIAYQRHNVYKKAKNVVKRPPLERAVRISWS